MKKHMLLLLLLSCTSTSLVVGAEAGMEDVSHLGKRKTPGNGTASNSTNKKHKAEHKENNKYWIGDQKGVLYPSFVAAFKAYIDPYCLEAKTSVDKSVAIDSGTFIMSGTNSGGSIYPIGDLFYMLKKTDFPVETEFSVSWAYQKCLTIKTGDPEKRANVHCIYLYKRDTGNAHLFHLGEARYTRSTNHAIVDKFFPLESNNDTFMFTGVIVAGKQLVGTHL